MLETITRDVFMNQIDNPMGPDLGTNIEILISNSNQLILGNKQPSRHKTKYTLSIKDPVSLGLVNSDQVSVETFFNRIILSFNLVLKRPVLATFDIIYSQIQLSGESIRAVIGFKETINEEKIIEFLNLQRKLEQIQNQPLKVNNLQKSILTYQNAIESNLQVLIFKDLYNSLELAVNSDGSSNEGPTLDGAISSIAQIPQSKAEQWRCFYNRIKHVNRNTTDLNVYSTGLQNLRQEIRDIRTTVQTVLMHNLTSL